MWSVLSLPDGQALSITADGTSIEGSREALAEHFVYVVEHDDGRLAMLSLDAFEKLAAESTQADAAQP